jgi:hypothetical protein
VRHGFVPASVATLAWAEPGQALKIRRILRGAGPVCRHLRPSEIVECHEVTSREVVLRLSNGVHLRIPVDTASMVQIERTDFCARRSDDRAPGRTEFHRRDRGER